MIRALAGVRASDTATGRRIAGWQGLTLKDAMPLRIAGGFHHLLLTGDVKRPGVILRDLNTAAGQGLKATDAWAAQGPVTPEQCRSVLGEAYPTLSVR